MHRERDQEAERSDRDGDLDALAEIEADAAEDTRDLEELEDIDEAIEEGWEEYGEEGEERPEELEEEEAEPELTLDHLLRFEDAPEGETEEDERRAQRTAGLVNALAREPEPDEFLCQSCFLLKKRSQLADPRAMLCRDCVDPA